MGAFKKSTRYAVTHDNLLDDHAATLTLERLPTDDVRLTIFNTGRGDATIILTQEELQELRNDVLFDLWVLGSTKNKELLATAERGF